MSQRLRDSTLRKVLRVIGGLLAFVLIIAFAPYLLSRATAAKNRVQVLELAETEGPKTPGELRVVAYNIAHLRGLPEENWAPTKDERDRRADQIAALLRELDADVVVLNEVDFDASWSHRIDGARLIAERADYPLVVEERNLDFCIAWFCWRFGNAILSRVPLEDVAEIDLPALAGWEEKLAGKKRGVVATLRLGDGNDAPRVRLAGVHLSHRSEDLRTASAVVLDSLAREGSPLIVAGDLNAAPSSFPKAQRTRDGYSAFRIFDGNGRFKRRPAGQEPAPGEMTFPSNAPDRVLDWVLVPSSMDFRTYRIVKTALSDHLPVVTDIVWGTPPAPATYP